MKYFILVAIVIICGYIGYGLSKYYSNRAKFFKHLIFLFEKLSLEINYSQPKLISIMQDYQVQNKDISKLINNFVFCLENNVEVTNTELFKDIKILNEEEKNTLYLFFLNLGKFDVINQTKQLEGQLEQLKILYKQVDDESKKYSPLYLKLGIIVGLGLALILL